MTYERMTSCYESNQFPKKGDLLVAIEGEEFDISLGRIYVAESNAGEGTFSDCVFIKDDTGNLRDYSIEYFAKYDGRPVHYR